MADRLFNRPNSGSSKKKRYRAGPHAARLGALAFLGLSLFGLLASAKAQDPGSPETLIGHGGPVMGIDVEPVSGRVLTASFDYSVILWSLKGESAVHQAGGTVIRRLIGHNAAVNDVAFVPGTETAVSVSDDGSMIVWNLVDGTMIGRFQDTGDKVLDVALSADGRYAAIARWDSTARLIDLDARAEVHRFEGHRGNVNAVALSADGTTLYTGSYDGTVRAWDSASGKETALIVNHGWGVNTIILAGGSLVFGGLDGSIARIDLDTGSRHEIAKAERPVLSLDLSADGSRLAAGDGAGMIRVFDTADWTLAEQYSNPTGPVWGLAFADTAGDTLYHSGLDDFAVLWQVQPRLAFEMPKTVYPRRFQMSADMSPGERLFQRRCSVCHTLVGDDRNRAGPTLFGIFGRKAGTLPDYPYSDGLRKSDIIWNEETIARLFDHGPDVVTPGTKMPIQRLKNPVDRNALIAFLKTATAPQNAGNEAADPTGAKGGDDKQ